MKIPEQIAKQIYIILEDIGASSSMRESFISTQSREDCHEWRFQGLLGFGGKFWNDDYQNETETIVPAWWVNCYPEDETPKRLKIIKETNEKLQILANEISKSS